MDIKLKCTQIAVNEGTITVQFSDLKNVNGQKVATCEFLLKQIFSDEILKSFKYNQNYEISISLVNIKDEKSLLNIEK